MLVKPIPGTVPKKLRDIGLKTLLSMKYRYDKLYIVEDLSSDRFQVHLLLLTKYKTLILNPSIIIDYAIS